MNDVTGHEVYTYHDKWGVIRYHIDADGNWCEL